jgi:hypothetical protein
MEYVRYRDQISSLERRFARLEVGFSLNAEGTRS